LPKEYPEHNERECRGLEFLRLTRNAAFRPEALLRHPQESNPEVIREVSVEGIRSEKKRSLSCETVGTRCTHIQEICAKKNL